MHSRYYFSFCNIKLVRISKKKDDFYKISILGVPFFLLRKKINRYDVSFWFFYCLFNYIKRIFSNIKLNFNLYYRNFKKYLTLRKIRKKYINNEKIIIVFLIARPGMWPFDYIFNFFKQDKHFEPYVVVMPDMAMGKEMICNLNKTNLDLTKRGYTPILGYDELTSTFFDLRNKLNPDIIFYSDFWKPHFYDSFYISNFLDKITLLIDYGFSNMQEEKTCCFELNNLVDIYFRPTQIHVNMAQRLMKNKGKNTVVVGAPKLDERFDKEYQPKNVWKYQTVKKFRIIWAPHHSCNMPKDMYCYNSFWQLHDFMFQLAENFKNNIQIAFRPHPMLYGKVVKTWGKSAADAYYKKWDLYENTQLYEDGNFIDLFYGSDAMITDSCSFLSEYTAFEKPIFHAETASSRNNFNDFGNLLYEFIYKPSGIKKDDLENGIIDFINNVVIKRHDIYKEKRHKFVKNYLSKYNDNTASLNVYLSIMNYIRKGKVS